MPESANLPVSFVSEYWTGNNFSLNTNDSCTVVPRSAITYPSGTLTVDMRREVFLTSAAKAWGNYASLDGTGVHFIAGTAGHYFSAPSPAGTGSFTVGVNLTSPEWLRSDWDQDGNYSDDTSLPAAQYNFGSYRGNDRMIYWHEKMQ